MLDKIMSLKPFFNRLRDFYGCIQCSNRCSVVFGIGRNNFPDTAKKTNGQKKAKRKPRKNERQTKTTKRINEKRR